MFPHLKQTFYFVIAEGLLTCESVKFLRDNFTFF